MFFKEIANTHVLIQMAGAYISYPAAERNGEVYAKVGPNTYRALTSNNGVSGTNGEWIEFQGDMADRITKGPIRVLLNDSKVVKMDKLQMREIAA